MLAGHNSSGRTARRRTPYLRKDFDGRYLVYGVHRVNIFNNLRIHEIHHVYVVSEELQSKLQSKHPALVPLVAEAQTQSMLDWGA
jgi:hypothetical protein